MTKASIGARRRYRQRGIGIRLIAVGIAALGGLVTVLVMLFSSDPIAACVEDGSGSPPSPAEFAVALADCVQPAVAASETPGEAAEAVYAFLEAIEGVEHFGPLVINNWRNTPDALKSRAFTATMSRVVPYLRGEIETTVHGTGEDERGVFVHVSYKAAGPGNRGTTLRIYIEPGPYAYRITGVQFAPVG
ncbi:MAG: hypothetical protein KI792_00425 [Alphaproteobacteria bacterium]|nr:hypothetical protein [Alphaproteobacteria bacterium SS10]